ncbi:Uncharacterised protein [Mycobacterium tuberculosis]|nr:Uncharacterised protein [Mycobacterium tuberculosis]
MLPELWSTSTASTLPSKLTVMVILSSPYSFWPAIWGKFSAARASMRRSILST